MRLKSLVISVISINTPVENRHAGGLDVHTAGQTFNQYYAPTDKLQKPRSFVLDGGGLGSEFAPKWV